MAKDFFLVVKERRSIRKYKDKEVSKELIEKIIDAARWAPSGLNLQPWEFVVVTDKSKKKKIRQIYADARKGLKLYEQDTVFVENAVNIFVLSDKTKLAAMPSTWLAIENILLAAAALGLGSIVMTAPVALEKHKSELRKLLNIPENFDIVAHVLVGYKDEEPEPKPRRDIKSIVHYERF